MDPFRAPLPGSLPASAFIPGVVVSRSCAGSIRTPAAAASTDRGEGFPVLSSRIQCMRAIRDISGHESN
jgi:hypothetical protein